MDEVFTPEQEKFLSTPEGKKILEIALERASSEDVPEDPDNFQKRETDFIRQALKMLTDSGSAQPMTVDPEFVPDIPDSIDEVGYDPKVFSDTFDTIDEVGYDPDVDQIDIGASQYIPGVNRAVPMDPNITLKEMERQKMLAQLMANQQTRTA
jgi:hypothetical protein